MHLYTYGHAQTCAHTIKHFNFYCILVCVCVSVSVCAFVYMHMCRGLRMEVKLVRISSVLHQVGSRN